MIHLPEHWQYAALGAFSMTPILGVFWSTARGWRLKALQLETDLKDFGQLHTSAMILEGVRRENDAAVISDKCDRLNRIIARGKTQNPNSTVKAMVRIAEGS